MATPRLPKDEVKRRVDAVHKYLEQGYPPPGVMPSRMTKDRGAIAAAADELGVDASSLSAFLKPGGVFQRQYGDYGITVDWSRWRDPRLQHRPLTEEQAAARRGELGFKPVLPGFQISETATTFDKDGNVKSERVTQSPENGEVFSVPNGHRVKGVSSYLDSEGRIVGQWIKTREDDPVGLTIEAAKEAFEAYRGWAKLPPVPQSCDSELLTVYPLADLHLGMFAWGRETGEDYDLGIAVDLIRKTFASIIAKSPPSKHAVVLGLGDLLHADNSENRTMKSSHALDVDTRYQKVLFASATLLRGLIEMAAARHERVTVRLLPGNHDEYSTLALTLGLSMFFDGRERVTVDADPGPYWFSRFGVNLLGGHHGHLAKPGQFAGIMASHCAQDWGATIWRHMFSGHLHHARTGGEDGGMTWEVLQTIAPKDAYNAGKGYWAGRSLSARFFHIEDGPCGRVQENIRPSLRRAHDLAVTA